MMDLIRLLILMRVIHVDLTCKLELPVICVFLQLIHMSSIHVDITRKLELSSDLRLPSTHSHAAGDVDLFI